MQLTPLETWLLILGAGANAITWWVYLDAKASRYSR